MQSTRFACDRCRGQKLRCIRENGYYQPCKRCQKASVDCIDGPQARNNRTHRISNEPETREPTSATFQRGSSDFFPVLAESPFVGDAILPQSADIRFGDASDVDLSADCWRNWDTSNQSPPGSIQPTSLMPSRQTSLPTPNLSDNLRTQRTLPTTGDYAGRNTEYGDHRRNENGGDSQGPLSHPNPSALLAGAGDVEMDFSMESEMKQLLALTHSLYLQQRALESAPWAKYLSSLSFTAGQKLEHGEDGAGKAIGDILSNSERFLKIITRFLALTETRGPPSRKNVDYWTPADVSLQEVESGGNHGGWTTNPNSSTAFQQNATSSASVDHFLSPPTGPPTPDQLDTPTILLVLNCYNRLLFIYATLFSHIKQYLSSSSPTASSSKISNLGTNTNSEPLHIGGFSLGSYGDIQIKVLVDISVHFITRIQKALGVPLNHTLMGDETAETMELCDSPGTDGGLSEIPQMKMLLETFIKTVGMDGHEGTQERGCGFMELKKEFKELQRLHRWKL